MNKKISTKKTTQTQLQTKKDLQNQIDKLATDCLTYSGIYFKYNDKDLMNAILVFSHFLLDVAYTANIKLDMEAKSKLAEVMGETLREFVRATTGKDTYKLVK